MEKVAFEKGQDPSRQRCTGCKPRQQGQYTQREELRVNLILHTDQTTQMILDSMLRSGLTGT